MDSYLWSSSASSQSSCVHNSIHKHQQGIIAEESIMTHIDNQQHNNNNNFNCHFHHPHQGDYELTHSTTNKCQSFVIFPFNQNHKYLIID